MLDNNTPRGPPGVAPLRLTGVLLSLSVIMSLPPVAPCYRCIMLSLLSLASPGSFATPSGVSFANYYLSYFTLCNLYIFINCDFIIFDILLYLII